MQGLATIQYFPPSNKPDSDDPLITQSFFLSSFDSESFPKLFIQFGSLKQPNFTFVRILSCPFLFSPFDTLIFQVSFAFEPWVPFHLCIILRPYPTEIVFFKSKIFLLISIHFLINLRCIVSHYFLLLRQKNVTLFQASTKVMDH